MSAQVAPTIPRRPVKGSAGSDKAAAQGVSQLADLPPRPMSKRLDRSVSPGNFPRSPLNEPFNPLPLTAPAPRDDGEIPRKPSVQQLPSVGQEGMEYAEVNVEPEQQPDSAPAADDTAQTAQTTQTTQTRSIAHDLHLHAPRPSLPKATATAQVQTVTRTDSSNAAAHGIGKPGTPAIDEPHEREILSRNRSRASFSRPGSSASGGRRSSFVHGDEQGPAELGIRVPINPHLGDVQAPSPAPFTPSHTGQSADGQGRHGRKKSAHHAHPPGSYGLHGHGLPPHSPFDRDWYAKHPEEAAHEEAHGHGVYEGIGSGRGAFALSSDDLNRIVHSTASHGTGLGTTSTTQSYPDEELGYEATAEYASRSNSTAPLGRSMTNGSLPVVESPLRNSSIPTEAIDPVVQVKQHRSSIPDEDRKDAKTTAAEDTIELKPSISHASDEDKEYRAPILAADEVAKLPNAEALQPAIHPRYERRSNSSDNEHRSGDNTPNSRPSSRPTSLYGLHSTSHSLSRFVSHHDDRDAMHTPLEDVHEYEPLFTDEDGKQKDLSPAERFKSRPELAKHRFPSQDIWEDAPSSVNHTATVSTPDLPQQPEEKPSAVFETPEAEAARRVADPDEEKSKLELAQEQLARRPVNHPRFPSRDIWEDSPDSHHLVTVVQSEPTQDEPAEPAELLAKPTVPPRPAGKSKNDEGASTSQAPPSVPPRPAKKTYSVPPLDAKLTDPKMLSKESSPTDLKKVPSIPDRPKPQIPPRPAKKAVGEGISRSLSSESVDSQATEKAVAVTSPPLPKVKPQIPARPAVGAKIASLKGNFMNDLNQKLGLGPPKEKEPEPEAEAKPLGDARKGRAKGPQRRAPARSPATAPPAPTFSLSQPRSLWAIDHTGLLTHHSLDETAKVSNELEDEASAVPGSTGAEAVDHNPIIKVEPVPKAEEESKAEEQLEKSPNPPSNDALSSNLAPTDDTGTLTHASTRSTESIGSSSGASLKREDPDPSIDAIPVSRQTTASSDSIGTELEREPSREEEPEEETASIAIPTKDE